MKTPFRYFREAMDSIILKPSQPDYLINFIRNRDTKTEFVYIFHKGFLDKQTKTNERFRDRMESTPGIKGVGIFDRVKIIASITPGADKDQLRSSLTEEIKKYAKELGYKELFYREPPSKNIISTDL
jgi:hypothetical protein